MASLSPKQRIAYLLFAIGGILPILFIGLLRPIFWIAAFQLACVAGLAYLRWRSPAIRGSIVLFVIASITALVSLAMALAV